MDGHRRDEVGVDPGMLEEEEREDDRVSAARDEADLGIKRDDGEVHSHPQAIKEDEGGPLRARGKCHVQKDIVMWSISKSPTFSGDREMCDLVSHTGSVVL